MNFLKTIQAINTLVALAVACTSAYSFTIYVKALLITGFIAPVALPALMWGTTFALALAATYWAANSLAKEIE